MALRKYPWEKWFSVPRTELVRGVDYHISQAMMHVTIRNNAYRRALRARVTDTGTGMLIEMLEGKQNAVPDRETQTSVAGEYTDALVRDDTDQAETAQGHSAGNENRCNTTPTDATNSHHHPRRTKTVRR